MAKIRVITLERPNEAIRCEVVSHLMAINLEAPDGDKIYYSSTEHRACILVEAKHQLTTRLLTAMSLELILGMYFSFGGEVQVKAKESDGTDDVSSDNSKNRPQFVAEWREVNPPDKLIGLILETFTYAECGLPKLTAVTTAPIIGGNLTDGVTVICRHGYHADSQTYLHCPNEAERFERFMSSPPDIKWARGIFDEGLKAVSLQHVYGYADVIGAIIGHHMRHVMLNEMERWPMVIINATKPGSGKSTLMRGMATWMSPQMRQSVKILKNAKGVEDTVTTMFRGGRSILILDNLTESVLDSPILSTLATETEYDARKFHAQESYDCPNDCTVIGSVNGARLSSDWERRTLLITCDLRAVDNNAHAWEDMAMDTFVTKNRTDCYLAVLTFVRAWIDAGMPMAAAKRKGSFPTYQRIIGGILAVAGIEGFCTGYGEISSTRDPHEAAMNAMVEAWWRWQSANQHRAISSMELADIAFGREDSDEDGPMTGLFKRCAAEGRKEMASNWYREVQRSATRRFLADGVIVQIEHDSHCFGKREAGAKRTLRLTKVVGDFVGSPKPDPAIDAERCYLN